MKVGESYQFKVLSMPSPEATTLPHSKDDVVVVDEFTQLISSTDSVNTDVVTELMGNMTVKENELSSEGSSADSNNHDLVSSEMQSDLEEKPLGASNIVDPVGKESILFELFKQLSKLGKTTLKDIFGDGNVQSGRYVDAGTDCPSVGILKCTSNCISIQDGTIQKRVFIEGVTDLPLKAISYPEIPTTTIQDVLLVIGLGREFQPDPNVGKRCYLMVVGIFIN